VDRFLQDLSKYYEIVLFSPSNFGVVDPITWTLDKQGLIMHRLYRDATRFHKGKHVKDLSKLNRDLRKVVIVDDDADAFQFQPENGIRIKPFLDPKDKGDRSLDKLRKFLLAVVMEGVSDDIPAVLRQFKGLDADAMGDAYEQRLRAAKTREAERHMKGLGGLLRKQKAFQGVANPFAGTASGEPSPPPAKGLSAKDIVGGAPTAEEQQQPGPVRAGELPSELQPQQSAPPPPGPVKKGKLWERYQNYLKEAEEDQRRKLELWQRKQAQREEEARRAALQQQQAAGGR
jgi:mitochondrial import inner membrane translocase subunit TIM50